MTEGNHIEDKDKVITFLERQLESTKQVRDRYKKALEQIDNWNGPECDMGEVLIIAQQALKAENWNSSEEGDEDE